MFKTPQIYKGVKRGFLKHKQFLIRLYQTKVEPKHFELITLGSGSLLFNAIMNDYFKNQPETAILGLDETGNKVNVEKLNLPRHVAEFNDSKIKEWDPENNRIVLESGDIYSYKNLVITSAAGAKFSRKITKQYVPNAPEKFNSNQFEFLSKVTNEKGSLEAINEGGQLSNYSNVYTIGPIATRPTKETEVKYNMLHALLGEKRGSVSNDETAKAMINEAMEKKDSLSRKELYYLKLKVDTYLALQPILKYVNNTGVLDIISKARLYFNRAVKSSYRMIMAENGEANVIKKQSYETCLYLMDQFTEDMDMKTANFPNNLSRGKELGRTVALIYWHFVDIVWIFLFIFVYIWNNLFIYSR